MASNRRERELARMRAERQAARRAAAEARRRKQRQTLLAAVGGLVAVGVVVGIVLAVSGGSSKNNDSLTSLTSPSGSAAPSASASASAASLPPGSCAYTSSGTAAKALPGKPPATAETTRVAKAVVTTNLGEIDLSLNAPEAPCTVNSFRYLAAQKYFDATSCHRLTTSGIYVLQCGDPTGTGGGGPGYQFADENLTSLGTGSTVLYKKGTVAMANAGPGTNGSQFFLVYQDTQLPASYTPFGTITKGLDLLAKVAKAGSDPAGDGRPKLAVELRKVTVS